MVIEQTNQEVEQELEVAVYQAAVKIFERMEHARRMMGNGHHAAQKVARMASRELMERWHLDMLSNAGQTVKNTGLGALAGETLHVKRA